MQGTLSLETHQPCICAGDNVSQLEFRSVVVWSGAAYAALRVIPLFHALGTFLKLQAGRNRSMSYSGPTRRGGSYPRRHVKLTPCGLRRLRWIGGCERVLVDAGVLHPFIK